MIEFTKVHPEGLIPASAGQTAPVIGVIVFKQGSSPRVRGRRPGVVGKLLPVGLIPASAGQTTGWNYLRGGTAAHPRECGADKR